MFSAKSLFQEILDNDESFRLFCSVSARGELQGGWENARIAGLLPDSGRGSHPRSPATVPTRATTSRTATRNSFAWRPPATAG